MHPYIILATFALATSIHAAGQFDTVAVWDFDSWKSGTKVIADRTGHGFDLSGDGTSLESPLGPAWDGSRNAPLKASGCPELGLPSQGSNRVRYEVKIFLSAYPSSQLHNGRSVVMGFYAGPKIMVTDQGSIQIGGQRGIQRSWNWFNPESRTGVVPLRRWTELAIEVNPATGKMQAWVDNNEVQLFVFSNLQGRLRPASGNFTVGADPVDGQLFPGLISQARVLRSVNQQESEPPTMTQPTEEHGITL